MSRHVKGVLFADYVRMMRACKSVDWSRTLAPADLAYLHAKIAPDDWYPMETFERFGDAILAEVAGSDLQAVRSWGRFSVDALTAKWPQLVAPGEAVETLMRFRVLRSTFFDFEALTIPTLVDGQADIVIAYQMGAVAEEAACYQTMGFFERLLELGGATNVYAQFVQRSWMGDEKTRLDITWDA
ncbi:MAG: hypothetical protein ABI551_19020 [Polyangiaceae bacterium]